MGKSVPYTFRVEVTDTRGVQRMGWDTKRNGRPTAKSLERWSMSYGKSFEAGEVNAHVSNMLGFIPYPTAARVIRQEMGEVVAEWKAGMFQVW